MSFSKLYGQRGVIHMGAHSKSDGLSFLNEGHIIEVFATGSRGGLPCRFPLHWHSDCSGLASTIASASGANQGSQVCFVLSILPLPVTWCFLQHVENNPATHGIGCPKHGLVHSIRYLRLSHSKPPRSIKSIELTTDTWRAVCFHEWANLLHPLRYAHLLFVLQHPPGKPEHENIHRRQAIGGGDGIDDVQCR